MKAANPKILYGYFDSPVGRLLIAGDGEELHRIIFPTEEWNYKPQSHWCRDDSRFEEVFKQLRAYFDGDLTRFDLPLRFAGTAFQNKIWGILCGISFGETITYKTLASRTGNPNASRAVGGANGANPIPIVVPCHRVIGSDKSLTGFAGGIQIKKYLLEHEQRILSSRRSGISRLGFHNRVL